MKKLLMFFFFMSLFVQAVMADGTLPSGSGTSGDPYQIASLDNLLWVSTNSTSWDKYFLQTNDIDASATATWNSSAGWLPIGTDWDHAFYGQYNGGGYTISGLTINRSSAYQGFIGVARDGVVLQNINLSGVSIVMSGNSRVGALVGEFWGSSVNNCHISGTVKGIGSARIGGLIGQNGTTVSNCSFSGTVTDESGGSSYMGGLIGYNGGSVEDSYTSVSILGNNYAGGLVGFNDAGTISTCYSSTSESNSVFGSYYVGGLTGSNTNSSTVTESYSTADVVAYVNYAGGITGINNNSTISDCYCRGSVSRTQDTQSDFGSFIGKNENTTIITNCYATGAVIYQNADNPTDKGFIGNYSTTGCSNNFFDSQTSVQSGGSGATAKTTAEMNTYTTFESAGWDFKGESSNGSDDIWNIGNSRNDGYPYFDWQYPGDDVPTPITLGSFDLVEIEGKVKLQWQTASETENAGFIIQRKTGNDVWVILEDYQNDPALTGFGTTSEPHIYIWHDVNVLPGISYQYRLGDMNYHNEITWHDPVSITVSENGSEIPLVFGISYAYPNPFNPVLNIGYHLTDNAQITVRILNLTGQTVAVLDHGFRYAGTYELQWRADDVASGIYFVQMQSGEQQSFKKVLLIK